MGRVKKETVEFRFYEIPQGEPILALLGEEWNRVYGHEESGLHFHNLMEIGYCRRGEGSLKFDTDVYKYHTSMFTILPANYPHLTVSDGDEKNYWEYLYFDPTDLIREMYSDNPAQQKELLSIMNRGPLLLQENEYPGLACLIKLAMDEMRKKKDFYGVLVQNLMKSICVEILRAHNAKQRNAWTSGNRVFSSQITPALDYIILHYSENMKAIDLARQCDMSETHFRRLFEESINMAPMDYVNLVRIQKACDMLRKTSLSMDEVAAKVGFPTVSTFNRNFKKFLNTSPYQWKINPENYERKLQNFQISALKGW